MAADSPRRYPVDDPEGVISGYRYGWAGSTTQFVLSKSYIEILDTLSEGEIEGLVTGDYYYSGNIGETGYASATFTLFPNPPSTTYSQYLRSIYLNGVPLVNSQNQYNYQRIDTTITNGTPNGSLVNQSSPQLTISRVIGERLRGTGVDQQGNPLSDSGDFTKYYNVYNTECKGVTVNVRVPILSFTVTSEQARDTAPVYNVGRERPEIGDTLATSVNYQIFYKPLFSTTDKNVYEWIMGANEVITGRIDNGYVRSSFVSFLTESFGISELQNKDRAGFLGWQIKIVRLTKDSTSSYLRNQTYVDSLTEVYADTYTYPNTAVVRTKFEAEFFSQIPERSFLTRLLKVKIPSNYTPSNKKYKEGTVDYPNGWDGTFSTTKQWTDNPAWCFYDLITNPRYGLGKYINEASIDKWTLYEIGKYCDMMVPDGFGGVEPMFTCNLIINSREEAFKVVNDFASIFRAMAYYGPAGSIFTVQDSPKDPIIQFNNTNVENGDFVYSSSSKKLRHTVAIIRYNDKNNFYKPAIEYVEDMDGIRKYGIRELELTAFGCTSRGQALRLGRWALLSETTEAETVSFTAGLEGAYLRPGDVFTVTDSYKKSLRYAGRTIQIENNTSQATVTLDDKINLPTGSMYSFSLLTPGYFYEPSQISNLSGVDYSGIRKNMIQKINFTGIQSTGTGFYNGKTTIVFDQKFNTTDYFSTGNLIWTIGLASGNTNYNDYATYVDPNHDYYRVINVSEKDVLKYEVNGLQYNVNKYQQIVSGLNFQRPINVYRITPEAPKSFSLSVMQPTPNTKSIYYSFIQENYSGVTSYRVYAKNGDYADSSVPTNTNLVGNLPVGITYGTFIPSTTGRYFFRAYSYNDDAGIYSNSAATGNVEILGINPIRDVIINSLMLDNLSGTNSASSRQIGSYKEPSPIFRWQVGFDQNYQTVSDFKYRVSIRKPSNNNIPDSTIYYQDTGYIPPNPKDLKYQFDIDTNAALTSGPYRNYDIVVEAIDASGRTSAGNVWNPNSSTFTETNAQGTNWATNPNGYDIFYAYNLPITGINLTPTGALGYSGVYPPHETYRTSQFITPNGDLVIKFKSGEFPKSMAGMYVFASTGNFHTGEIGANYPWMQTVHADWDYKSKTAYARTRLWGASTGYFSVVGYDVFDNYFIEKDVWSNIGSGLTGRAYNVSRAFASGFHQSISFTIDGKNGYISKPMKGEVSLDANGNEIVTMFIDGNDAQAGKTIVDTSSSDQGWSRAVDP